MSASAAIRVFVVDDHPVMREGLKMLVNAAGDARVVGDAGSARAAVEQLRTAPADVVLLDIDLGPEDGIDALPALREAAPSAKILVVTALRDRERHRAALVGGARGLVLKDKPPDVLMTAIRKVHAGELWFDRALLETVVQRTVTGKHERPDALRAESLTAREREVVALVSEGLKNGAIARRLSVTEKTVRNHLTAIFDKLGVSGRLELLVYAYKHDLVKRPY